MLFTGRIRSERIRRYLHWCLATVGAVIMLLAFFATTFIPWWVGAILLAIASFNLLESRIPKRLLEFGPLAASGVAVLAVGLILTDHWLPLGPDKGFVRNILFVTLLIGGLLAFFQVFQRFLYRPLLGWCLANKALFLVIPVVILLIGSSVWLGFDRVFGFVPASVRTSSPWKAVSDTFPGLGKL